MKRNKFRNILAAAVSVLSLSVLAQGAPKVFVVMFDGLRADALESANVPNVTLLKEGKWQDGYKCAWTLTGNTILDGYASSAPNHQAIATGVTAAKTGQRNNGANICDHVKWPSWLSRLVAAKPEKKAMFMFSWGWDKCISPDPKVKYVHSSDAANAENMAGILASADAPDAIMWFIDLPDHGGHGSGFYPFSQGYFSDIYRSDSYFGKALKAIASRPTFAEEDWLIVVLSDHGGYARTHGLMNGHATTVPILVAGKNVREGRIAGTPHLQSTAATALRHFGIDTSKMELDGGPLGTDEPAENPSRALSDALEAYLSFDGRNIENHVAGGPAAVATGRVSIVRKGIVSGGALRIDPTTNSTAFVKLAGSEKLAFENGGDFAMTMWVRMDEAQKGDPVIAGNKNWTSGRNPGVLISAAKRVNKTTSSGVAFNAGCVNNGRFDLGAFDVERSKWTFYAATRDKYGSVRFYQGRSDGYLYWVSENAKDFVAKTGLPFCIGQDGTGAYPHRFKGCVDDFALWRRTLSHEDVRRIFEAGRKGVPFADLLK